MATTVAFVGAMMWTEYLVFRTGRFVFAPAIVAATGVLPFGVLHRFVRWFNGNTASPDPEFVPTDLEDPFGDLEEEEDSLQSIRFTRRDLMGSDSEGEVAEDEEDFEEEHDEEEVDDEESEAEQEEASVPLLKRGLDKLREKFAGKSESAEGETAIEDETEGDEEFSNEPVERLDEAVGEAEVPAPKFVQKPAPKKLSERDEVIAKLNEAAMNETIQDYALPDLSLLIKGETISFEQQQKEAMLQARILEKTCREFGYNVKVVEIESGPVISQYEIQLEAGLRLQKIVALADDLAIALRVPSVRIVAPIPGKNTVGIEVPNETRQVVRLRDVMELSEQALSKQKIPLFLGKDAVGRPMVADLAALPHLLIAGRTGTGKSVCLNAIISSILMTRRPDEVRMLMIDPKMVELSGYGRLPHLMHPVVTDMRKAEAILAWAVDKMEDRYRLLARAGVRHLTSYNQLGQEELMERLKPENDAEAMQIPNYLPSS